MFRRSVRALCVVNTAAFKKFRAELADQFARLDADRITALQLRAQARQEQQLAEVAAGAFKPSVDIADHALLIADLEAYRAQLTDDGDGTYAYIASLVKALESSDDGEAIRKTVRRSIIAWAPDADRHGLDLIFKAADALQPRLKVLSAEVKGALVELEAAIPTATPVVAERMLGLDIALRTDERALAHRYIRALQERMFTPEEQAQYAPLVKAIEAAIMEKCFAECLSASVDHPDVFDLSKVFFDEPVAGSPCVLCVFSDQQAGPLLPLRAHRTKLRDASQFVVNEEFTKAVNFYVHEYNVDSAIAVYGDRGAGKTMLVTWGPQCPVLYFEGKFPIGCDWAVLESSPHKYCEHRGEYTAALVLLQLAKKLAELGILEAPHTEGELNDVCTLAKTPEGREELSAFAKRVFHELGDLKQKRLFEQQERIAIVFDEEGADPALARCIRDAETHIRPQLTEWLNVKHVLVVVSGCGLRLDPAPRLDSRPVYLSKITAAPKLTFEALLPAADHQRMKQCLVKDPLLQSEYDAALTNARLAVLTAAQVTAAFRTGSTDLRQALRTAMAECCESNAHLSSASVKTKRL